MIILHIVDKFKTGVATAIKNYVALTPEYSHILLYKTKNDINENDLNQIFTQHFSDLSNHILKNINLIRKLEKKLKPDVIHLHSTFAGIYGRLALKRNTNVVYTPHCFAFERQGDFFFSQKIFFMLEWLIAKYTKNTAIAGCSQHEYAEAKKLTENTFFIPNCSRNNIQNNHNDNNFQVCMVGRICKQKNPTFFLQTYRLLKDQPIDFIWIGGSEKNSPIREAMQKEGIIVTGWIQQEKVKDLLNISNIYFHTALWEGFPISLIEAAQASRTIILKSADYLEGEELSGVVNTPEEASKLIMTHYTLKSNQPDNANQITKTYNCTNLQKALYNTYNAIKRNVNHSS